MKASYLKLISILSFLSFWFWGTITVVPQGEKEQVVWQILSLASFVISTTLLAVLKSRSKKKK